MKWECPWCHTVLEGDKKKCNCGHRVSDEEQERCQIKTSDSNPPSPSAIYDLAYQYHEVGDKPNFEKACHLLIHRYPSSQEAQWAKKHFKLTNDQVAAYSLHDPPPDALSGVAATINKNERELYKTISGGMHDGQVPKSREKGIRVMKENIRVAVSVAIIVGIVWVGKHFHAFFYSPKRATSVSSVSATGQPNGSSRAPDIIRNNPTASMPLSCVIWISDFQKTKLTEIPGLNVGAGNPLPLLRPVGEMLSESLLASASRHFRQVRIVEVATDDADVILNLGAFDFGTDTGYSFKGIPILLASGSGHTTIDVSLDVKVKGNPQFKLQESGKGSEHLSLAIFPLSRLSRTMTEASENAAIAISEKLVLAIVSDKRVRALMP